MITLTKTISVKLLISVFCVALFRGICVECVHITGVSPVQFIQNGSSASVTLDCQFEMDEHRDAMLVLKWFLRGDPLPVYQWIISKNNRQYSDKIDPYVDKDYTIDDKLTRYRAIRLISPPMSLSGVYECSVHSLDSHDIKTTELIVYASAKSFTMIAIEVDNGVNITCKGTGLYPEPKLSLFRLTQSNDSNNINAIEVKDKTSTSLSREDSGQYDITLTAQVYEDSYAGNAIPDHYECRLIIEKTDYMEARNIAIQSGWHTRPHLHNTSDKKSLALVLLLLPLLAVIKTYRF